MASGDLKLLITAAPQAIIPDSFISCFWILFAGSHSEWVKGAVRQFAIANLGSVPCRTHKATLANGFSTVKVHQLVTVFSQYVCNAFH
jgi:hypothetical protein